MFVDYVRECMDFITLVKEINTTLYCASEQYQNCPFYKSIKKIGCVCEMVSVCPMYKNLSIRDFDRFKEICRNYCLSDNNVNCVRYKMRKSGNTPPPDLMPDGGML
jgi:hypothetical protein